MEKVFLYEQSDYDPSRICEVAKEIITASGVEVKGKSVLLKPSFVYPELQPADRRRGDPAPVHAGRCQGVQGPRRSKVLVGEDSVVGPARSAFYAMGIYPFIRASPSPSTSTRSDT